MLETNHFFPLNSAIIAKFIYPNTEKNSEEIPFSITKPKRRGIFTNRWKKKSDQNRSKASPVAFITQFEKKIDVAFFRVLKLFLKCQNKKKLTLRRVKSFTSLFQHCKRGILFFNYWFYRINNLCYYIARFLFPRLIKFPMTATQRRTNDLNSSPVCQLCTNIHTLHIRLAHIIIYFILQDIHKNNGSPVKSLKVTTTTFFCLGYEVSAQRGVFFPFKFWRV